MDATVLITGVSGGLGQAVAESFSSDGWRVVAPTRSLSNKSSPSGVAFVEADLSDAAAVLHAVEVGAGDAAAPLRAVVNLVGGYAGGARVHETPIEDYERQFALNLRPTYLVAQAALPHLRDGGAVVCVSSRAAVQTFAGAAGYMGSKAAVIAFVQAVAVEYREEGIRCNAVLHSIIDTSSNRRSQPDADRSRWYPRTPSVTSFASCAPMRPLRPAAPLSRSTDEPERECPRRIQTLIRSNMMSNAARTRKATPEVCSRYPTNLAASSGRSRPAASGSFRYGG